MTILESALLGIGFGVFLFTLKAAINIIEPPAPKERANNDR